MAELRCPTCGKSNPDILSVCQFCQTPLKKDSVLRIGQTPTKKNTGELEAALPDWLKDVRQQARDTAEEEESQTIAQPRVEKNEPPDLLAGLASQADDADEDGIPDWLASINPTADLKSMNQSTPAPSSESDFFAQFRQSEPAPASEPVQELTPPTPRPLGGAADQAPASAADEDDLSRWFAQASAQPEEVVKIDPEAQRQGDAGWVSPFDASSQSSPEPEPKEKEDLSWLHNLEAVSKQTGDLQAPKADKDWTADFEVPSTPSQPSAAQEDLSWLNNLAGIEGSQAPVSEQPSTTGEDLSWLNNLGAVTGQSSDVSPSKPADAPPFVSEEDLSWLNNLGGTSEPAQPAKAAPGVPTSSPEDLSWLNQLGETPEPARPAEAASRIPSSSPEDLSWLNQLGGTPEPSQPVQAAPESLPLSAAEDLSWLNSLGGGGPDQQFTPPFAESESVAQDASGKKEDAEPEPDWLKSALETPSMPAPGDTSMDWFTSKDQPMQEQQTPPAGMPQPAPFSDIFAAPGEPASASGQDVDSLFSVEMPDWLSHSEPAANETGLRESEPSAAQADESLAPVDLPSWVQAMRPVEAVISETAASGEEEPEEKQGPLAGLRGVIPGIPIGSSVRPKAISLKLQATNEQQSSAALLEKILDSETTPRALITSSFIASQRWLRIALAGLFVVVLGIIIAFRSNTLPIPSGYLPQKLQPVSNIIEKIPEGGRVVVIVDYEPALSGEMEAVGNPVLAHLTFLRHPVLSFVSTSPSGPGLVERLMTHTKINKPISDPNGGFGYVAGEQYLNLGYLPGGSAGVLGFVKGPGRILPAAGVQSISEYAAVILMTDHAESGRVWVEQLYAQKQKDPLLTNQPLLVIASAQADPLLQPYVSSQQISATVSGLSDAARYESVIAINASPKLVRSYWDAFGFGLAMSIALIVVGSLWSLFAGIRARRAESEQG